MAKTLSNPTAQKARRKFLHAFPNESGTKPIWIGNAIINGRLIYTGRKRLGEISFGDCWRDGHLLEVAALAIGIERAY